MRDVAIRQDGSKTTYIRGHVVTDRNATHEKRIRVGRVLRLIHSLLAVLSSNRIFSHLPRGRCDSYSNTLRNNCTFREEISTAETSPCI